MPTWLNQSYTSFCKRFHVLWDACKVRYVCIGWAMWIVMRRFLNHQYDTQFFICMYIPMFLKEQLFFSSSPMPCTYLSNFIFPFGHVSIHNLWSILDVCALKGQLCIAVALFGGTVHGQDRVGDPRVKANIKIPNDALWCHPGTIIKRSTSLMGILTTSFNWSSL